MSTSISRRHFLRLAGAVTLGFATMRQFPALAAIEDAKGYGALLPDPDGIFDLPRGFSYRVMTIWSRLEFASRPKPQRSASTSAIYT